MKLKTKLERIARKRIWRTEIFGTFGKALTNGLSLNFDVSGGANCDTACVHHPESTAPEERQTKACYAARTELRPDRSELTAKLKRHKRLTAAQVCGAALLELQRLLERGAFIPWLRISTNGSVPQRADVSDLFVAQFRALLSAARDAGIPVHFPIETARKARFYRRIVGDLVCVRESCQTIRRFMACQDACSVVCGDKSDTRLERVAKAQALARRKRRALEREGLPIVGGVCPAVLNSFAARRDPNLKNDNAKCGACTWCADVRAFVIYPLH